MSLQATLPMRLIRRLALVLLVLLAAAAAAYGYLGYSPSPEMPTLSAIVHQESLSVGSRERSYLAYVPLNLPKGSPLVIVLHGSVMSGKMMRRFTAYEFDELADQKGFAVVYPDGYKHNWNDCRRAAPFPAKLENVDDVGFLRGLIAHMQDAYGVSAQRVFAFGYSNGGQMAFRLAQETPTMLAGVAVAGSNLPTDDNTICNPAGPTPRVMLVNGTRDPLTPINGGEVTLFGFASRGYVISSNATAEKFASRNGLGAALPSAPLPHSVVGDPTRVASRTWLRDGKPFVVQYVVENGGHVVPQQKFRFPRLFGTTTQDLDFPARAVEFFLQ
jgi:polyhydroxybutyrate depolymerase